MHIPMCASVCMYVPTDVQLVTWKGQKRVPYHLGLKFQSFMNHMVCMLPYGCLLHWLATTEHLPGIYPHPASSLLRHTCLQPPLSLCSEESPVSSFPLLQDSLPILSKNHLSQDKNLWFCLWQFPPTNVILIVQILLSRFPLWEFSHHQMGTVYLKAQKRRENFLAWLCSLAHWS